MIQSYHISYLSALPCKYVAYFITDTHSHPALADSLLYRTVLAALKHLDNGWTLDYVIVTTPFL